VLSGASSNKAVRGPLLGELVVKLATIEDGESDVFRATIGVPSHFGDSGDREGKLVRDLSEMDDAELDM
jgi:hypothetical protein